MGRVGRMALAVLCCSMLAGCATEVAGDPRRPDFPAAAAELRAARALVPADAVTEEVRVAVAHIDEALAALPVRRPAAADVVGERPQDPPERLHYVLTHLDRARVYLTRPEADGARRARRDAAIGHVAHAQELIGIAIGRELSGPRG